MKKNKKVAPKPAERQVKGFNRLSQALHGALTGILSNMRLSLTFRIAMHYAFQLLRTTLAVCLFMTICLIGAQVPSVQSTMRRIAVMVPDNTGVYRQRGHSGSNRKRRMDCGGCAAGECFPAV